MRILQDIRESPLQHSRQAAAKARSVIAQFIAATAGLNPNQLDALVLDEFMENSNRVGSTAYAGDDRRRQLAFSLQDLCSRFTANHRVKIAHHGGIRMSTQNTAQ